MVSMRFLPLSKHSFEPVQCCLLRWGAHATTRVHYPSWRCGGVAVRRAGTVAQFQPMNAPVIPAVADRVLLRHWTSWRQIVAALRDQYTVRRLRLVCGWVMFCYLTLHFLNHSLGNISLQAMIWGTQIQEWIWHGPIGGPAYQGASAHRLNGHRSRVFARRRGSPLRSVTTRTVRASRADQKSAASLRSFRIRAPACRFR